MPPRVPLAPPLRLALAAALAAAVTAAAPEPGLCEPAEVSAAEAQRSTALLQRLKVHPAPVEDADVRLAQEQVHRPVRRGGLAEGPGGGPAHGAHDEPRAPPALLGAEDRRSAKYITFFAGIEGAGHHFLKDLMEHMGSEVKRVFSDWCLLDETTVDQVFEQVARLPPEDGSFTSEVASYPCGALESSGNTSHAVRLHSHPNLDMLERAAKRVGTELRVILLHRKVEDCLAADCLHRLFEHCEYQADTLLFNALELSGQLEALDSENIFCFEFGDLESMERAVSEAFGPDPADGDVAGWAAQLVRDFWHDPTAKGQRDAYPGWAGLAESLAPAEAALARACERSKRVSLADIMGFAPGQRRG